mmetsp:Transcript_44107/g.140497  ORF Transcript_44107/g.140497 Transcript_44107/m.140497 type:complete len:504 (+) Transcript_44107:87-1598(+)
MEEPPQDQQDPVKARIVSISLAITQPLQGDHDLTLVGLRPKDRPKPAPQPQEAGAILRKTLRELPKDFIVQLVMTVLPLTAQLLAFGLGAICYRLAKENSTLDRASGLEMYEYAYYGSKSVPVAMLTQVMYRLAAISWGGMFYFPLLLMWNFRIPLPRVVRAVGLCVVFHVVGITTAVCVRLSFPPDFRPTPASAALIGAIIATLTLAIPYAMWYTRLAWQALAELKNPVWRWMYLFYNMAVYTLALLYLFILRFLMGTPDAVKLCFVILVNAPLMEALAMLSRFTARCVRHNDPTTSWMPICVVIVFKKLWMRFVVGTMQSSAMVAVAELMVGILEILGRVTIPTRDKFAYRKLFGPYLGDAQPLALMTHARNRSLRAEIESLEGVLDTSFIIIGCVWPFMWSTSLDGKGLPVLTELIRNGVIQWTVEYILDVFINIYMTVVQKYDLQAHGNDKCPYWSLVVALITFSATLMLPVQTMGFIVCARPDLPEGVQFAFCSALYD